jgi:hypothetical protein
MIAELKKYLPTEQIVVVEGDEVNMKLTYLRILIS